MANVNGSASSTSSTNNNTQGTSMTNSTGSISSKLASKNNTQGTESMTVSNVTTVTNSASTMIAVVLNKSKRVPKPGKHVVVYTHMGVIKETKDQSSNWMEFRFANLVPGATADAPPVLNEAPTFHIVGKNKENKISGADLISKMFSTDDAEDIRFHVDMPEEVVDAFMQSDAKAIKVTFDLSLIGKGKDTPFLEVITSNYYIKSATFEVLDAFYGIGKTIDKNWVLECLNSATPLNAGNVQTKEDLAVASLSREASNKKAKQDKKKAFKRAESASATQTQVAAESVVAPVIAAPVVTASADADDMELPDDDEGTQISASSFSAAKSSNNLLDMDD